MRTGGIFGLFLGPGQMKLDLLDFHLSLVRVVWMGLSSSAFNEDVVRFRGGGRKSNILLHIFL